MGTEHPFRTELRKRLYPVMRLSGFTGRGNRMRRYSAPMVCLFETRGNKYPEYLEALIRCDPVQKSARELLFLAKIALHLRETTKAVAFARIAADRIPPAPRFDCDEIIKRAMEQGVEDPAELRRSLGW